MLMNRFEAFSEEEMMFLIFVIRQSPNFWSPCKERLLNELKQAYQKKHIELHSGVGGGA